MDYSVVESIRRLGAHHLMQSVFSKTNLVKESLIKDELSAGAANTPKHSHFGRRSSNPAKVPHFKKVPQKSPNLKVPPNIERRAFLEMKVKAVNFRMEALKINRAKLRNIPSKSKYESLPNSLLIFGLGPR